MRFSVWPSLSQPWSDVVEVATHAEATGWDGVYVADHFMGDGERAGGTLTPMLEATAGLAGLAAATDRVRLGSLVFGITYRHPAVLAKWAATVDHDLRRAAAARRRRRLAGERARAVRHRARRRRACASIASSRPWTC